MKLFFIPLFLCLLLQQASAQKEHVILCGGPALLKFEKLRISVDRHDRFWGNFVRASTIRIDEIRKVYGPFKNRRLNAALSSYGLIRVHKPFLPLTDAPLDP